MNYYEHHLGDYLRDTAHLSMIEDAAYRRLLDAYYIRERALPADVRECCKLARAQSKPERDAVAYVLREFFDLRDDGHHQRRADAEIERFQDKQAKAKRSAEARWSKRETHSEGNANASSDAMRTHSEGNAPRARPQSPDTKHKNPQAAAITQPPLEPPRHLAAAPPGDGQALNGETPPAPDPVHDRALAIAALLRPRGMAITPGNPTVLRWAADPGITDAGLLTAFETAEQRRAGSPQPVNVGLVDAILADMTQQPRNGKPAAGWWESETATLAHGRTLGMNPRPGESMGEYRSRLREAKPQARPVGEAAA